MGRFGSVQRQSFYKKNVAAFSRADLAGIIAATFFASIFDFVAVTSYWPLHLQITLIIETENYNHRTVSCFDAF